MGLLLTNIHITTVGPILHDDLHMEILRDPQEVSSVRIELVSTTGKTTVLKAKTPLLSGREETMGKA